MIVIILLVLHISVLLAMDRRNLISPLNALLIWIWLMIFRATEITLFGEKTLSDWAASYITHDVLLDALLTIGLFVVFFLSGFSIPLLSSQPNKVALSSAKVVPVGFILLMALGGMIVVNEMLSQLPDLLGVVFLSQGDPGEFYKGKGLLLAGLSLLPSAVLAMLFCCRTSYGFALTALLLLCVSFAVYAPLGQRGNIITYIILALSILTAKYPRLKARYFVAIGLLIFVGMGALLLWRTAIRWNSTFDDVLNDFGSQGMDRGDFDAFAGVVAYGFSIDYESWWSFAIQLIPRFLYPSKEGYVPVSYLMNDEIIGEYNAGLTTTIIGTLFAQGGSVMVAIGGFILGVLVRVFQSICISKTDTPNRALLGGLSTAFILFLTRNGDLTNVVVMLVTNLLGTFLLMAAIATFPIWRRTCDDFSILPRHVKSNATAIR